MTSIGARKKLNIQTKIGKFPMVSSPFQLSLLLSCYFSFCTSGRGTSDLCQPKWQVLHCAVAFRGWEAFSNCAKLL